MGRKEANMATCFVIQPFDCGKFHRRYKEIFKPAIEAADLEPYRVDEDPSVSIPIDWVEKGIREAAVCLADITENNPNVLFEIGYAIACGKQLAIVRERNVQQKFPFDLQHRAIILYDTETPSDYATLQGKITERLKALGKKEVALNKLAKELPLTETKGGLSARQRFIITIIGGYPPNDPPGEWRIRQSAGDYSLTAFDVHLALRQLTSKNFLQCKNEIHPDGQPYLGYSLTEFAWQWIERNEQEFTLQRPEGPR
jgi:hypothetical protein